MQKNKGQIPILINWDQATARKILNDTGKVVVLDWDRTLIEAIPQPPIGQKAPSEKEKGFLGKVRYGLNGEHMEHALFLRPHVTELIEACKSAGYKLVLWSQGVPDYIIDCLKRFKLSDKFDLIIPRHPSGVVHPKDLWMIRPDLTTIVTVDDSLDSSVLNPFNAIEVGAWRYTNTSDRELIYIPSLLRHRFLALEDLSPDSLLELRELTLRQIAREAARKIYKLISNDLRQQWRIMGSNEDIAQEQGNLGVSGYLRGLVEENIQNLLDITLLTLITYDLNTLLEVMMVQISRRNLSMQKSSPSADERSQDNHLREIDAELRQTVRVLKKIFERLVGKAIEIV